MIWLSDAFFQPAQHTQFRDEDKKKELMKSQTGSGVTDFNKVQQGRKDCTRSEKQLGFTTSADLNTFTPPPPLYQRLHSSADSPIAGHRRRRSFCVFIWMLTEDCHHLCKRAVALRHLPAVNIRPGLQLPDNSQLPNWLCLFSFAVINVPFGWDKRERRVISSGGGGSDFSPPSSHTPVSHLRWLLSFLFLVIKKTSPDISEAYTYLRLRHTRGVVKMGQGDIVSVIWINTKVWFECCHVNKPSLAQITIS